MNGYIDQQTSDCVYMNVGVYIYSVSIAIYLQSSMTGFMVSFSGVSFLVVEILEAHLMIFERYTRIPRKTLLLSYLQSMKGPDDSYL